MRLCRAPALSWNTLTALGFQPWRGSSGSPPSSSPLPKVEAVSCLSWGPRLSRVSGPASLLLGLCLCHRHLALPPSPARWPWPPVFPSRASPALVPSHPWLLPDHPWGFESGAQGPQRRLWSPWSLAPLGTHSHSCSVALAQPSSLTWGGGGALLGTPGPWGGHDQRLPDQPHASHCQEGAFSICRQSCRCPQHQGHSE